MAWYVSNVGIGAIVRTMVDRRPLKELIKKNNIILTNIYIYILVYSCFVIVSYNHILHIFLTSQ